MNIVVINIKIIFLVIEKNLMYMLKEENCYR